MGEFGILLAAIPIIYLILRGQTVSAVVVEGSGIADVIRKVKSIIVVKPVKLQSYSLQLSPSRRTTPNCEAMGINGRNYLEE